MKKIYQLLKKKKKFSLFFGFNLCGVWFFVAYNLGRVRLVDNY